MHAPRLVVAGTHSGVGKTTVTLGLMAALQRRNLIVQGFKVGPDYIDPSYHTALTGRTSRNLDSWMLSSDTVKDVFLRASRGADLSIVEGVMGFYDGKDPRSNQGSTAEISLILDCPVILVVDAYGMARSTAAIVKGFQAFDHSVHIAGVIANRVGGDGHFQLIKQAVEHTCGVPVLGYLTRQPDVEIPERHLGLIPAIERGDHDRLMESLGAVVSSTVDLDMLLSIARKAPDVEYTPQTPVTSGIPRKAVIAVAKDAAFNFYYAENLELLECFGAELVYFSPLKGEKLPSNADGLYIGGGFPEEFAAELSAQQHVMQGLRTHIDNGLPTYAECGGYMYLSESLTDQAGRTYKMVGVIPACVTMQERLAGFGYREVTALGENWLFCSDMTARGHEFHYSTMTYRRPHSYAYQVTGYSGTNNEGYRTHNVVAGYTHLHFGSNPKLAQRFVDTCVAYRANSKKGR